jgi:cytochrome c
MALILSPQIPAVAQEILTNEKSFSRCRACHQVGETAKNATGPILNGLFGRKAGGVEGYNYSNALKESGIVWSNATLTEYIKNPKAMVPGTKIKFSGIKDEARINDLIAYLRKFASDTKTNTLSGSKPSTAD